MKRLIYLSLILFLAGCSTLKINTQYDRTVNFSNYNTWCWFNNCTPTFEGPDYIYPDRIMDDMVNFIALEMDGKGYKMGDDLSDLLVDFHVIVVEDSTKNGYVFEEDLPLWDKYKNDQYYHFLKGTLIIDVADRKKGKIIYRSVIENQISKYSQISNKEIMRGIKKALKDLPPRSE
ncbi:MAG TPA: DUF4136 domain-containing protein [Fulvivirga sp.]|nr:DUF4136 domain-containing protein [Fulvivirga sp.]